MSWLSVIFITAVIIVVGLFVATAIRRHRTEQLRRTFGPEYERTVARAGDEVAAESELRERQALREELEVHPLDAVARKRYVDAWQATQAEFADDPATAIHGADRLIQRVMRDRGYPVEDFDASAAIVSVDHPVVVERYRRAHTILQNAEDEPDADALEIAMQDYGAVFTELVEDAPEDIEATG